MPLVVWELKSGVWKPSS